MLLNLSEVVSAVQEGSLLQTGSFTDSFQSLHQDSRKVQRGDIFICITGQHSDGHAFISNVAEKNVGLVIGTNREVLCTEAQRYPSVSFLHVHDIQIATLMIARAARLKREIPVITLTGASGKTTTKDFLCHILSQKHKVLFTPANNNNLWGVPLALANIEPDHSIAVLETGTNASGEVLALTEVVIPTATYTTSIGESHLEFLKSIDGVLLAETEQYIWMSLYGQNPTFFANVADPILAEFFKESAPRLTQNGTMISISSLPRIVADVSVVSVSPLGFDDQFGTKAMITAFGEMHSLSVPFPGVHNVANALAAVTIAATIGGFSFAESIEALRGATITGLRSEMKQHSSGAIIFNDCYNANPGSMRAAFSAAALIKSNPRSNVTRMIAVLGDMLEMGEHSSLMHQQIGEEAKKTGFDLLLTTGEFANDYKIGFGNNVTTYSSKAELIAALKQELRNGDVVLIKSSHGPRFDEIAVQLGLH